MSTGKYEVTRLLAEALGLPDNASKAVLILRANHAPLLRVTTVVLDGTQLKTTTEAFTLVKKTKVVP